MGCGTSKADDTLPAAESSVFVALTPKQQWYSKIIQGKEDDIKALYKDLDSNSDGNLEANELKDVVTAYDGRPFDPTAFFEWYDTHGKPDGKLDLAEFSWFLAEWGAGWAVVEFTGDAAADAESAKSAAAEVPGVIDEFRQIVQKQAQKLTEPSETETGASTATPGPPSPTAEADALLAEADALLAE